MLRDRERVLIRAREASTGRIVEERFDDVVFACGAEVIWNFRFGSSFLAHNKDWK